MAERTHISLSKFLFFRNVKLPCNRPYNLFKVQLFTGMVGLLATAIILYTLITGEHDHIIPTMSVIFIFSVIAYFFFDDQILETITKCLKKNSRVLINGVEYIYRPDGVTLVYDALSDSFTIEFQNITRAEVLNTLGDHSYL